MVMIERREIKKIGWLSLFVMISLFFMGCPDPIEGPRVEYILTITTQGEGLVLPDSGKRYDARSMASIFVFANEGWEFDGWRGSHGHQVVHVRDHEYQIYMNGHKSIHAVFTKKPTLPVIVSIEGVEDIEVLYGTPRHQAIGALAPTTTILDSHNQRHRVDLTWRIDGYNGFVSGDYLAIGTFSLPQGVVQPYPPLRLEVQAIVTVLPQIDYYSISGRVHTSDGHGIPHVTISFSGDTPSVTTNIYGHFSQNLLYGTVTVTPSKDGYIFSPPNRQVTGPTGDVNFVGTSLQHKVSGTLSIVHDWPHQIQGLEGERPIEKISGKIGERVEIEREEAVPGQIIVGLYSSSTESMREEVFRDLEAREIDHIPSLNAYLLEVDEGRETMMIERARRRDSIAYAEPNYYGHALGRVPNDPFYPYQWHYPMIRLPQAWSTSIGDYGVRVAVLDTGIDTGHPDLGTMVDTSSGYNFIDNSTNSTDFHGHGTHVAGTIGADTNNRRGVAGVMWEVTLIPVKVLDDSGNGTHWSIANGILYAAGLSTHPYLSYPAHIINMSLGSANSGTILEDAIHRAHQTGAILIAATGNTNTSIMYPARYPEVIAVGAVDYNYPHAPQKAHYSCYGIEIDVVAPGGDVRVDTNFDGYSDGVLSTAFDYGLYDYFFYEGTSMATPHVSGVVGLMLAAGIDRRDVRDILTRTSMDLGSEGFNQYYGYGLINAYWAVHDLDTIKILVGERQGNTIMAMVEREVSLNQREFTLDGIPEGNYRVYGWIDVRGNGIIEPLDYLATSELLSFGGGGEYYVDLVLREVF